MIFSFVTPCYTLLHLFFDLGVTARSKERVIIEILLFYLLHLLHLLDIQNLFSHAHAHAHAHMYAITRKKIYILFLGVTGVTNI